VQGLLLIGSTLHCCSSSLCFLLLAPNLPLGLALQGLLLIGPTLHFWYGSLGTIVKATGNTGAIMRLSLDQLCFAPVFISTIVSLLMVLEGKGPEVVPTLKRNLPDMVKSNWMLWVPFQFINFRFVPPHLQVLMSNLVALAWNVYMSYKAHH
jgi:hypothetical protein